MAVGPRRWRNESSTIVTKQWTTKREEQYNDKEQCKRECWKLCRLSWTAMCLGRNRPRAALASLPPGKNSMAGSAKCPKHAWQAFMHAICELLRRHIVILRPDARRGTVNRYRLYLRVVREMQRLPVRRVHRERAMYRCYYQLFGEQSRVPAPAPGQAPMQRTELSSQPDPPMFNDLFHTS
jgi:hypothetical protein